MSDTPNAFATVEAGDYRMDSNSSTVEEMREVLTEDQKPDEPEETDEEKVSKAASELGKKGGEAAAKARSKAEKEEAKAAKDADKGEEAEEKPKKGEGNPRHDPEARVRQATRQAAEARRELEAERQARSDLERRLEALERGRQPSSDQPKGEGAERPVAKPNGDAEPQEEDFENYRDFVKAQARWEARQEFRERQREAAERRGVQEYTRHLDGIVGRAVEARRKFEAENPDFGERVSPEVLELQPSVTRVKGERLTADHIIADEILLSGESGPALMLHLSDHPEDLQRLRALPSPNAIQVETRLIVRSLRAATAGDQPQVREVSKAKPPLRPVSGSPQTNEQEPDDYDAYVGWANARERKAQARR